VTNSPGLPEEQKGLIIVSESIRLIHTRHASVVNDCRDGETEVSAGSVDDLLGLEAVGYAKVGNTQAFSLRRDLDIA
jgi:hypothetical protein